ncbi:MAG: hypothetical protein ATN36_07535 [Epulopiscium sp. Nele67-Bin005]|nr:MAG: hypothetical protein ATN36_07535 [Epulopiscium sp. Nele67-Bin005]
MTSEQIYELGKQCAQEKDFTKAYDYYKQAAEAGNPNAQYEVGRCLYEGEGVAINYKESKEWLMKASDNGHGEARFLAGYCFRESL